MSASLESLSRPTEAALDYEWQVIFETRLGLMTDGRPASDRQVQMAKIEADEARERLRLGR